MCVEVADSGVSLTLVFRRKGDTGSWFRVGKIIQ